MKICKRCEHKIPGHWRKRFCPYCGYGIRRDQMRDKRLKRFWRKVEENK